MKASWSHHFHWHNCQQDVIISQEPENRPTFAAVNKNIVEYVGEDYDETFE